MKKMVCFLILFCAIILLFTNKTKIVYAQTSLCNDSQLIIIITEEDYVNKEGIISSHITMSFANKNSNCMLNRSYLFGGVNSDNVKNIKVYDNLGPLNKNITSDGTNIDVNRELNGGEVYKFFLQYEQNVIIKDINGIFHLNLRLQTANITKGFLVINIEKQDPIYNIVFSAIDPYPNNVIVLNNYETLVWIVEPSAETRLVVQFSTDYLYKFNSNYTTNLFLSALVGLLVSTVYNLLARKHRKTKKKHRKTKK